MKECDDVLEHLEGLVSGGLPDPELAAHLEQCSSCLELLRRARATGEGGQMLHQVRAPEALKQSLKRMARLPQRCERAVQLIGAALDGEADDAGRDELLEHLHECPACRATWEALATLREVGSLVRVSGRTRARLQLHPRQHVSVRRERRVFDLRLATAAAYLLAALTVFLVGNPAQVARASNTQMEKAAVYTRAAVENRVAAYSREVWGHVVAVEGWAEGKAKAVWESTRRLVTGLRENPKRSGDVVTDGKGGRS
jgi:predicted anti-sigma-YlaC factor YlaD